MRATPRATPSTRRAQAAGRPPAPRTEPPADAALIARYLAARGTRLGALTAATYRADLLAFARAIAPRALLDATPEDITHWIGRYLRDPHAAPSVARPWSRRTAHRKRAALSAFYRWACRTPRHRGGVTPLIGSNPCEMVDIAPFSRRPPIIIPHPAIPKLFAALEWRVAAAEPRARNVAILDAAVFRLCYPAALRISEIVTLTWDQLTQGAGEWTVRIVRKGGREGTHPITGVVRDALARWLAVRRTFTPAPGHQSFIFVHPGTGRRVHRQRIWEHLKRAATDAGLPPETIDRLTPHKFRHTLATEEVDAGTPIPVVQLLLGHARADTTLMAYVRPNEAASHARSRAVATREQAQLATAVAATRGERVVPRRSATSPRKPR